MGFVLGSGAISFSHLLLQPENIGMACDCVSFVRLGQTHLLWSCGLKRAERALRRVWRLVLTVVSSPRQPSDWSISQGSSA